MYIVKGFGARIRSVLDLPSIALPHSGGAMILEDNDCRKRLELADHGILGTVHERRGVDLVPVCFAVIDDIVGIPVDLVKAKSSTRLQREANLRVDGRATLLVENWSSTDWSALWWVRSTLVFDERVADRERSQIKDLLSERYAQYADQPFSGLLCFRLVSLSGWKAGG